MKTEISWIDGVHFSAVADSNVEVKIDGPPDLGGKNLGARPMELMLMGIGGCTATDVMHILRKSRCEVTRLNTCVSATRSEVDPKVFESIHFDFQVQGENLSESKVKRAIELSHEKYCSASILMQRAGVRISHDFEVTPQNVSAKDVEESAIPTLKGLHHVALLSANYEETRNFYTEQIGMTVEWEPDEDNVYLTSGSDNLAIHRSSEHESDTDTALDHIGFIVNKIEHVDVWYNHLRAQGIDAETEPKTHRDGARSFYLRDPDGTRVQIIFHPPLATEL